MFENKNKNLDKAFCCHRFEIVYMSLSTVWVRELRNGVITAHKETSKMEWRAKKKRGRDMNEKSNKNRWT